MLQYAAVWLLVRVAGRWPGGLLALIADVLGTVAWYCSPRLRAVTRDHMRHALGVLATQAECDRAARGCVRSAARYYVDLARGPYLDPPMLWQQVESIEGLEHVYTALDRGKGVILLSAHVGSPEFIARAVALLDIDLLILTEPLAPPQREAFVQGVRMSNSRARFVPAGLRGVREALEHLRCGGVLAVLGDRDVLHTGRRVTFFGERAQLPAGPVELALRTGAPIVPGVVLRARGDLLRIVVQPPIELRRDGDRVREVDEGMLAVARALERGISKAPEQWFALEPIWTGLGDRTV